MQLHGTEMLSKLNKIIRWEERAKFCKYLEIVVLHLFGQVLSVKTNSNFLKEESPKSLGKPRISVSGYLDFRVSVF